MSGESLASTRVIVTVTLKLLLGMTALSAVTIAYAALGIPPRSYVGVMVAVLLSCAGVVMYTVAWGADGGTTAQ